MVIILRHSEKIPRDGSEIPNPFLSISGRLRARALPSLFDDGSHKNLKRKKAKKQKLLLPRPTIAFAPFMGRSGSVRPRQTISPLVDKFNLPYYIDYETSDVSSIAKDILSLDPDQVAVVVWAREYIPALAQALMVPDGHFPRYWDSDIYTDIWTIQYESSSNPTEPHIRIRTRIDFPRLLPSDTAELKKRKRKGTARRREMCTSIFQQ